MRLKNGVSRFFAPLLVIMAACLSGSCIYDDLSKCGITLQFRYTYNMLQADAFRTEADWVEVYVFDADARLVARHRGTPEFKDSVCSMKIPALAPGQYSFVAWAGGSRHQGEYSGFVIADLAQGAGVADLTATLPRNDDGSYDHALNSLLNGSVTAGIDGSPQVLEIPMLKCTKDIRVILLPMQDTREMVAEEFTFSIEDANGTLDHEALPVNDDRVVYRQYYRSVTSGTGQAEPSAAKSGTISSALIADLNTSRLMYGSNPRLKVRDELNGNDIIDIDLGWYLTLQAIGEHRHEWDDQEYLDRQDSYTLSFFIDMDTRTWLQTRIVINGWVISLTDVEL